MVTLYLIIGLALDLDLGLLFYQLVVSCPHHLQFSQTIAKRKPSDCSSNDDWDYDPKEDEGKRIFSLDIDLIGEGNRDFKSFIDVCQFSSLQPFIVLDLHYYA